MKLKNILVCPKLGITFSLLQFRFYYDENCRKLSMLQNLSQIAQHELTTPYLKINNKRNLNKHKSLKKNCSHCYTKY